MMDNQRKLEVKEKLFNLADQLADGEITIDVNKNDLVRFINGLASQIYIH